MISNPATFYDGEDYRSFTYEHGNKVFHFSPRDNALTSSMENNIILFANNEEHATKILIDLCKFVIKTTKGQKMKEHTKENFEAYLAALELGLAKPVEITPNQVFVVGWAFNDCLH